MTTSDQAFIRAYHQTTNSASQHAKAVVGETVCATLCSTLPLPEDVKGRGQNVGTRFSKASKNHAPKPHVEVPASMRHDIADRRHTCVVGEDRPAPSDFINTEQSFQPETLEEKEASTKSLPETAQPTRPLSAFEQPTRSIPFRAGLEVDHFGKDDLCEAILKTAASQLDALAEQVILEAEAGRSVFAVASDQPKAGCTTAVLCLAKRLSAWGAKVAIVDATFQAPSLVKRLGIATTAGWEDVMLGHITLAESLIASVQESITLLPLNGPLVAEEDAALYSGIQAVVGVNVLREQHDIVLIDMGSITQTIMGRPVPIRLATRYGVDNVLIVRENATNEIHDKEKPVDEAFQDAGINVLGIIDNFVPQKTTS